MVRSTWPLSFRKSTVVASIRVRGGQSFLREFYGALRYEPCTQFINVSQRALHIYFIDGCRRIKIERNNPLCEQAPTEVFRSIFAWLVTLNLHVFNLPVDGVYAMFFQEIIRLAERSAAKESTVRR